MSTTRRDSWLALNFAATIFVSAFLLFQVQPLVSKYILPWFGGSPAVWTTCMLFFQTLLFGGYAYAHLSQRFLAPKLQGLVHLGLIVVALLMLRVVPTESWKPTDSSHPVEKILLLLSVCVGIPYFVLSSTGPLLQAWFARTFPGRVPYRLYALSNVGSLLALLSYPFFFERIWDVPTQASFWSWGFVTYAALCSYAAISLWMMFRSDSRAPVSTEGEAAGLELAPAEAEAKPQSTHVPWWHQVLWVALPAVASVTLLATTNHVSTDVAPVPFLWVVPLSLYLLTFIIAFDHSRWYRPALFTTFTLVSVFFVAVVFANGLSGITLLGCGAPGKFLLAAFELVAGVLNKPADWITGSWFFSLNFLQNVALNFAAMFGICMLCHGELVRLRPHPRHLTAYFLMISAGGALGGAAVTLVAPQVFKTFFEFKLALMAGYVLAIGLLIRAIYTDVGGFRATKSKLSLAAPIAGLLVLVFAGAALFDLPQMFDETSSNCRLEVRNFFGTLSVVEREKKIPEKHAYVLKHGEITHGLQFTDGELRYKPTTYYSEDSGVGRTIGYYRQRTGENGGMRVGAVGLGTGTLAAYADKGDSVRFYEINPAVIEISEPGKWFSYLKDCKERGGEYEIVLGDARLTLERELKESKPQHFQVIVLDAFSGDAIPAHLLTEEAFQTYLGQLSSGEKAGEEGALAIHISNKYLDLEPIVRGAAEKFDLRQVRIKNGADSAMGIYAADWIILTKNKKLVDALEAYATAPAENPPPAILWTDGRSNLFDVLK